MTDLKPHDFGLLCICAVRYCQGRQSYMPDLIRQIVRQHLEDIEDNDLNILLQDCKFQADMNLFGDEQIDKPGWVTWKKELEEEAERRKLRR